MSKERDFRKLRPTAQAELRRVAVDLVMSGTSRVDAAAAVGVNRRYVGEWVRAFEARGSAAISGGRRGRLAGEQKALDRCQEVAIRRLIVERCPDQLMLPFALWGREAVTRAIADRTGIRLARTAVGTYLAAWGLRPRGSIRRAPGRDEAAMQRWMDHDYPAIVSRARIERAEVHWLDQASIAVPADQATARRLPQTMLSSVTNQGRLRFIVCQGASSGAAVIAFLERLVADTERKLFVIVDDVRVHRARAVMAWVAARSDRIVLCYRPARVKAAARQSTRL